MMRHIMLEPQRWLLLLVLLTIPSSLHAASAFDAASIRPSSDRALGEGRPPAGITVGPASLTTHNATLRSIVQWAYQLKDFQLMGPKWLSSAKYDIIAKAQHQVSEEELRAMLQALLAERCNLAVHHEQQEIPIFALVVGKNGTKLHSSSRDRTSMTPVGGSLEFDGYTMEAFADRLSARPFRIGRPVINKTQLTGTYDFSMNLAETPAALKMTIEGMDGGTADQSLFTIVQEQLGLRLEPRKGLMDVLIVDRVARPTPN